MKFRILLAALLLSFAGMVAAQTTTSSSTATAVSGSPTNTITVNGGGSSGGSSGGWDSRVASAASFALSVSNLTCGAQAGIGGQGAGFGFSAAMSYEFEHCVMIQDAITLHSLGHFKAAHARMCASAANRAAFKLAGDDACKGYEGTADLGNKGKVQPVKTERGVVHSEDFSRN